MTMLIFSTIQAFVLFGLGAGAILVGVIVFVLVPIVQRDEQSKLHNDEPQPSTTVLTQIKPEAAHQTNARLDLATTSDQTHAVSESTLHALSSERTPPVDYRQIIEHMEQIVFKLDADGNIFLLSSAWEQLLDYTIADSVTRPFIGFVHPEDRPMVDAQISGLLRGNRDTCRMEMRMIARNHTSRWLDMRVRSNSSREHCVIGTLTDINHQKEIEARLRAVRRSLSTLLNSIPGMVYRCKSDRNWSFEFASDGCLEVTGYEPYHLVNDPNLYFQHIMLPEDRDYAWNHVHKQVMLKRNFQLVYRIIDRSGRVKWIWEQGRGVYSVSGELLALEGFIRVIAEDSAKAREVLAGFHDLIVDDPVPS
jgi:PAS domain S-box-containing protein